MSKRIIRTDNRPHAAICMISDICDTRFGLKHHIQLNVAFGVRVPLIVISDIVFVEASRVITGRPRQ